ncbi:hypothetical protein BGZ83_011685 [Gryganskiella cystojenkinii]|nr:hypothetical protein BGZ83_011685 [Gryganskiella cystojenkinii]
MAQRPNGAFALSTTLLVTLLHIAFFHLSPTAAAAAKPDVVTQAAYASSGTTFFVHGGSTTQDGKNQTQILYTMSLSKSFNATSAPWVAMPSAGPFVPKAWQHGMMVTSNNFLYIWSPLQNALTGLNLTSGYWLDYWQPNPVNPSIYGYKLWVDASLNVYMPNACTAGALPMMCLFNQTASTSVMNTVPWWPPTASQMTQVPSGIAFYSFLFSNLRNAVLLYGGTGISTPSPSPYLYEFVQQTNSWTYLTPTGTSPGDVNAHCMAQTSDHSKMIIFGGINSMKSVVSAGLFILDVQNLAWTQGTSVTPSEARYGHVCASYGDSFLVWGGQNATQMMSTMPLIYHIPTNQWITEFVVSGPLPTYAFTTTTTVMTATSTSLKPRATTGSEPAGAPPPTSQKSSLGPIAGGAVGGIIVLAAIGFFVFKRYQRKPYQDRTLSNKASLPPTPKTNSRTNAMFFSRRYKKDDDSMDGEVDGNTSLGGYALDDRKMDTNQVVNQTTPTNHASFAKEYDSPLPLPHLPTGTKPRTGSYTASSPTENYPVAESYDGGSHFFPPPPPLSGIGRGAISPQFADYSDSPNGSRTSALSPHAPIRYHQTDSFLRSPSSNTNLNLDAQNQSRNPQSPQTNAYPSGGSFGSLASPGSQGTTSLIFNSPQYAANNFAGWGEASAVGGSMNHSSDGSDWELRSRSPQVAPPPSSMIQPWMMAMNNNSPGFNSIGSPQESPGNTGAASFPLPPPPQQQPDRFRPTSSPPTTASGSFGYTPASSYTPTSNYSPARTLTSSWSPTSSDPSSPTHTSEVFINSNSVGESAELKAKRLALKKAQLEFDLEQIRVEEQAQRLQRSL